MKNRDRLEKEIRIAAVVATHNRPHDLANRSLKSIESQTRTPDFLVVVDDSDQKYRRINEYVKTDFASRWTRTVYLGNYRTPGASGAWNTALAWLYGHAQDVFVAILDDDDSWEPTYLEKCSEAAVKENHDMVVAGMIRHDEDSKDGRLQSIPTSLNAEDFLTGNPHIQGSNLFIRLSTLLHAGGFDESLQSTTDRDLCIRLADLKGMRFGIVDEHLVNHYAPTSRERLSTYGSDKKASGLSRFYAKYGPRMTESQKDEFIVRCKEFFGCDPSAAPLPTNVQSFAPSEDDDPIFLVVGIISSHYLQAVRNLLNDLQLLENENEDLGMKIVVLENSGKEERTHIELRDSINGLVEDGTDIDFIAYDRQAEDAEKEAFGNIRVGDIRAKSIAVSRTMIQHYVYLECQLHPGAVAWILDDDSRTDNLFSFDGSSVTKATGSFVTNIKRLKKSGAAIGLCTVTGDPPLPFSSCIRTQLVDLYHNLERMSNMTPSDEFEGLFSQNMELRNQCHDYYYDLSRDETDHLETPFWYVPGKEGSSTRDAFIEMVEALPEIKNGRQVFRPLIADGSIDPLTRLIPSIHRGGNTLVFHTSSLRAFPNAVPHIHGKDTRRSDMVWCLLNRFVTGRKITEVPIPVRQDRSFIISETLDFDKLVEDIQGYATYSALQDVFQSKAKERQLAGKKTFGTALVEFKDEDVDLAIGRFRKYLNERTLAFELSFIRIVGLLRSFERYVDTHNREYWWLSDDGCSNAVEAFRSFIEDLNGDYEEERLPEFRKKVEAVDDETIRSYFSELSESIEEYRKSQPLVTDKFLALAESMLRDEFGLVELTYVGHGEEGVVFTDGKTSYKLFYHWKKRISEENLAYLSSITSVLEGLKTIYPIIEIRRWGENTCITYPYEPSTRYEGGRLGEILTFLRECKEVGIIYRNVHPGNFIVTDGGLRLVDYGMDIRPYNEQDFVHMCRRAYLMYRYHDREDLKEIMRKALSSPDMPELDGFEHFLRAVNPRPIREILYPPLLDEILSCEPESVLDYGCGKGVVSEELGLKGIATVGFDIDKDIIRRCRDYSSAVDYLMPDEFENLLKSGQKSDVIVCSLVLCTIEDDGEMRAVLGNIHKLVQKDGRVIVAVCNPHCTSTEQTENQKRILPSAPDYSQKFEFTKEVDEDQASRKDIHRPYDTYIQEFSRAGFQVEEEIETDGTDIENLVPASDFLILRLKPIKDLGND